MIFSDFDYCYAVKLKLLKCIPNIDIMSEVTSNWLSLCDTFYDKVELYSGVFSSISSTSLVVSGQYGGPVISLDRGVVTIFTSSGEQISAWKWNNSAAVAAGWSDAEEALFVLEDGTVLI